MKITIESLKKFKCKEVLHSLCPTDMSALFLSNLCKISFNQKMAP